MSKVSIYHQSRWSSVFEMSKFNLTVPSLGPKLPDFQKLVPEMRKEDLLGAHPDRQEMRNNVLRIEVLDTKVMKTPACSMIPSNRTLLNAEL